MIVKIFLCGTLALSLGACAGVIPEPVTPEPVVQGPSPEEQMLEQVKARAAPNQNVQSAYLRDDDNCYWFKYVGPVEKTDLPLLTPEGRHLCAPRPAEVVAAAPAES